MRIRAQPFPVQAPNLNREVGDGELARIDQRARRERLRIDIARPRGFVLAVDRDAILPDSGRAHVREPPQPLALVEQGRFRSARGAQPFTLQVELVHAEQFPVGAQRIDAGVDAALPVPVASLKPDRGRVLQRAGTHGLARRVQPRRRILSDRRSHQRSPQHRDRQRAEDTPKGRAGSPQDRDLRIPRQRAEPDQRAEKDHEGRQFVDAPGRCQEHKAHGLTAAIGLLVPAQFLHHREQCRQGKETHQHDQHGGQRRPADVAVHDVHWGRALRRMV